MLMAGNIFLKVKYILLVYDITQQTEMQHDLYVNQKCWKGYFVFTREDLEIYHCGCFLVK